MEKKTNSFKCHTIVFTIHGKEMEDDPEACLKNIQAKCDWVLGQQEVCPEAKRLHIQGMAWSKVDCRWGFMPGSKAKCMDPIKSIAYCTKVESRVLGPWEFGERPTWNVKGEKQRKVAEKNKLLIEKTVAQLVLDGDIPFTSVPAIIKAKNMWTMINPGEPKVKEENEYEWIWDAPSCGKTRYAKNL